MKNTSIQKLWDSQPFLEKLLFLMNKLNLLEDDASKIAKLKYNEISQNYKAQITQILK